MVLGMTMGQLKLIEIRATGTGLTEIKTLVYRLRLSARTMYTVTMIFNHMGKHDHGLTVTKQTLQNWTPVTLSK